MNKISSRLKRREFACRCGCGFMACDIELVNSLEELADDIQTKYQAGRCYIIIVPVHSGCRCVLHNENVQKKNNPNYKPGTSKSMHVKGMAADFHLEIETSGGRIRKKIDPDEVYSLANKKWPNKYGLGKYTTFTHLDVRPNRARW